MLLREIVLHNFGGYRGRHVVELDPQDPARPIILFGGLNGAGKTTFLDAMQLVLYGKRARTAGRGGLAYDEYLRRCINRTVPQDEGAALELLFDAVFDGATAQFRIRRSWRASTSGIREQLAVARDGQASPLLKERWDEIVEELMPLDIASLFFFDGEKIEALADPERAGQVIATAVESLLGLGLIERLQTDLMALERKKRTVAAASSTRVELDTVAVALQAAEADLVDQVQQRGALQNALDIAERHLAQARDRFRQQGGELFQQRGELEQTRTLLAGQLREVRDELVELAGGSLPLRLVSTLVESVVEQHRLETLASHNDAVMEDIQQRDKQILEFLLPHLAAGTRAEVETFMSEDYAVRQQAASVPRFLGLDSVGSHRLAIVWPNELDRVAARGDELLQREARLAAEVDEVDRLLGAVPAADAVAELSARCDEAAREVSAAIARVAVADEAIALAQRAIDGITTKRERLFREAADAMAAEEDAHRIVEHAMRVRETLAAFRSRLLERHLSRIEAAILDSLRRLLRKQRLVGDLRLDPVSFELTLLDEAGNKMSTERLSAGERQLLAVALLWGLARVSGKQLPTIVDTPLGRLDSVHRRLLAERYFPHASSQVLLLSTDEEIDRGLFEFISGSVGRSYELRFDDAAQSTEVVPGYFFDKETSDVA